MSRLITQLIKKTTYSFLFTILAFNSLFAQQFKENIEICPTTEEVAIYTSKDILICETKEVEISVTSSVPGIWIDVLNKGIVFENPTDKITKVSNLTNLGSVEVKWIPTLTPCQSLSNYSDTTINPLGVIV